MGNPKIRQVRIEREQKELQKVENGFQYEWKEDQNGNYINFEMQSKNISNQDMKIKGQVWLQNNYPFVQPLIKIFFMEDDLAFQNLEGFENVDFYYPNKWTPKMTVVDIISVVELFCKDKIVQFESIQADTISQGFFQIQKLLGKKMLTFFTVLLLICFRILIAFGSYSGYNDPPQYGDYEAQRHWLELTLNTLPEEWYRETIYNQTSYWPIDYPPLTAYVSLICGYFSNIFDPKSVELFDSRGYESNDHKAFMRFTVLIIDILFMLSGAWFAIFQESKKFSFFVKNSLFFIALMCPPFILIDHGHFQYNCMMLGLTLWGIYFCAKDQIVIGSIFYTLAFNFKQLGLYFALPFFCFILGNIFIKSGLRSHFVKKIDWLALPIVAVNVFVVGFTVISVFVCLWFPWLTDIETFLQTLRKIFPVQRGLYQLKVANFWCFSNIFIKWNNLFSQEKLLLIAVVLTLLFALPSLIIVTIRPKMKYFKLSIFNVALSFFFFSYHVHEKTILLPLLGLILNIRYFGKYYFLDFIALSCVTLYPLLKEDGLVLQYIVLSIFYLFFINKLLIFLNKNKVLSQKTILNNSVSDSLYYSKMDFFFQQRKTQEQQQQKSNSYNLIKDANNINTNTNSQFKTLQLVEKCMILSDFVYKKAIRYILFICIILTHIAEISITPPEKYPYIYSLIFAMLGFGQFFFTFWISNLYMISEYLKSSKKDKTILQKED